MKSARFILAASILVATATFASAAAYQWDANGSATGLGGTGTWNASNTFWDDTASGLNDGTDATVAGSTVLAADTVAFGGTAGTVTLGGATSIAGITFGATAGGYTLDSTGQTLSLGTSGITATAQTSGITTLSGGSISLSGNQAWALGAGSGSTQTTFNISSAIALGTKTLTITAQGTGNNKATVNLTGGLSGSGALTLSGNQFGIGGAFKIIDSNTSFTGNVIIQTGVSVTVDSLDTLGGTSSTGTITLGNNNSSRDTALIFNNFTGAISTSRQIILGCPANGATSTQTIKNDTAGSSNTLTFSNFGYNTAGSSNTTVLALGGRNGGNNTISANIRDNDADTKIAVTKIDAGAWVLSGANTYTGATTVNAGTLALSYSSATAVLNSTSALTLGGGTIQLAGAFASPAAQTVAGLTTTASTASRILLNSNRTLTLGALSSTGANSALNFNTAAGGANADTSIVGTSIAVLTGQTAGNVINTGFTVTDSTGFGLATVDGSNQVIRLTGAALTSLPASGGSATTDYRMDSALGLSQTVTGALSAQSITVDATNGAATVTVNSGVTLNNNVWNFGAASGTNAIAINGPGKISGSSNGTMNFNNYSPGVVTIAAEIANNGTSPAVFGGTGTTVLSGASTYTGATTVSSGNLSVSGSLSGTAVTVNNGATFAGTGTVTTSNKAFTVASGAKLDPGTNGSVGLSINTGTANLDISGAVGSTSNGALLFNLDSIGSSDKITLTLGTGSFVTGGQLDFADFAFTTSAGFGNGIYTLIDTNKNITGSLAASGLTGTIGGMNATLSLSADNTDVILTVVPEPGSAVALFGGLGMLLGMRRRSRAV